MSVESVNELKAKIEQLRKSRNAYIIVHNYQLPEVQEIADMLGDSLALSKAAMGAKADVIVFCGVDFMAESAKILNPKKTVLLPVRQADCPMSLMANPGDLRKMKAKHPDAVVVCYVNSSAEVKALSDIACTSANAVQIVKSLKEKEVLFVPDKNLGLYVERFCPEKKIIFWEGFCPTHMQLKAEDVIKTKAKYPDAPFIAHPECSPKVIDLADHVASTSGFSPYIAKSPAKTFIVGTERGMVYALQKKHPDRTFVLPTENLICPTMKMTTLASVAHALEVMEHKIEIPEDIRRRAERCLRRMMEVSGESSNAAVAGY